MHQCGSLDEALAAHAAGADALILQGVEAGGHVRGTTPALELLARVRSAVPAELPAAAGRRHRRAPMTWPGRSRPAPSPPSPAPASCSREESRAHPGYVERLLEAEETFLTELFGAGWPAPHRVIANAATERWLTADRRGPALNRWLNRLTGAGGALSCLPALEARMIRAQRPDSRMLTPAGPTDDGPETLLDAGPLYAGETVARIADVRPAADLVRALAP